jgi:hypothetical protein
MFGYATDKWKELRLARDAAGGLSGGVQGSGEETIVMGDVLDMATLTTGGSIAPDGTLPELRSGVASPVLPMGQLLVWDVFRIRAAEGVNADVLKAGLSLGRAMPDPNSTVPPIDWITEPTDATAWAGAVAAIGRAKFWETLGGIAMQIRAGGAAVVDRSAHSMASDFSAPFTFLDLGVATSSYPLEAPTTALPAKWGEVTFLGMSGTDATCESGICALLGPFQNNYCDVGRRGLAGRLYRPGQPDAAPTTRAMVRMRYRVMTAAGLNGMPAAGPTPFSIDVAVPGLDARTTEVKLPALHDLGAGAGEFRYVSDFLDALAPSPDTTTAPDEFGFAIYAGSPSTISCGPGGLLPPPVKMQIVIDKITIEPG